MSIHEGNHAAAAEGYHLKAVLGLTLPVALMASTVIASSAALWIARAHRRSDRRDRAIKLVAEQGHMFCEESIKSAELWLTPEPSVFFSIMISSVFGRMYSKLNTKAHSVAHSIRTAVVLSIAGRPWYLIRILPGEPVLFGAEFCEFERQMLNQSDCVTLCQYYPRLRDFVRHVRRYGFPRLYCPVLARFAQGVRAFSGCFQK